MPTPQEIIADTAFRYGVPVEIALAVAKRESNFNQAARGTSGEWGIYQLMPGTAQELGVDPRDTYQNIDGGIRYLRQQYDRFGNWPDALAAYNAGASRVVAGTIPSSTLSYVESILGAVANTKVVFTPDSPTIFSVTTTAEDGFPLWVLGIGLASLVWLLTRRRN